METSIALIRQINEVDPPLRDVLYSILEEMERQHADGEAYLVGECKAQPGKKDIERFAAMLERLKKALHGRIYPLLIGYSIAPGVHHYLQARHPGTKTALTYQIERTGQQ